ncbi:MAG: SOS response-associated peptidase [Pirellulales bacterium]|nr:SOS response-associated peptidase [Pirellulales bacterium]
MCGRFTLRQRQADIIAAFNVSAHEDWQQALRYNISPMQQVSIIRLTDGEREICNAQWWLVPAWSKEPKVKYRTFNAKSEEVETKSSFRAAIKTRRCLIPADGFIEWEEIGNEKFPHYFQIKERPLFAFAGLWERWTPKEGDDKNKPFDSCTILTTSPNEMVAKYNHERMPVILSPNDYDAWLSPAHKPESLRYLYESFPASEMTDTAINPLVNTSKNDKPECIEPYAN